MGYALLFHSGCLYLADTSCSGGVGCQPAVGYVLINEQ